jgi:hypothetical protein
MRVCLSLASLSLSLSHLTFACSAVVSTPREALVGARGGEGGVPLDTKESGPKIGVAIPSIFFPWGGTKQHVNMNTTQRDREERNINLSGLSLWSLWSLSDLFDLSGSIVVVRASSLTEWANFLSFTKGAKESLSTDTLPSEADAVWATVNRFAETSPRTRLAGAGRRTARRTLAEIPETSMVSYQETDQRVREREKASKSEGEIVEAYACIFLFWSLTGLHKDMYHHHHHSTA